MDFSRRISNYEPCMIIFYNREGHVLLREPSLLAVGLQGDYILALGEEAGTVLARIDEIQESGDLKSISDLNLTRKDVVVGSPFKEGAVADFDLAIKMLKFFLYKVNGRCRLFRRPQIAVCVPPDMTQIEHKAMEELILSIGAKKALIFEKPFLKAIGEIPDSYKIIIEILHPFYGTKLL